MQLLLKINNIGIKVLNRLGRRLKKAKPCGLVNCFINYDQFPHEHAIEDMIDELKPEQVEAFINYMKDKECQNEQNA